MAENTSNIGNACSDAVCIDAKRVYDSCSDQDCLSDLRVFFTEEAQEEVDAAVSVRLKDADVINVIIDIEPVPFHRGFYSIDMTYFFEVTLDLFNSPCSMPAQVKGLCISDKKVILYGSEGSVKVFSSELTVDDNDEQNLLTRNLPIASVQVAQPIALAATLKSKKHGHGIPCKIPNAITSRVGGVVTDQGEKIVLATLGVFSIIQLERSVQMLIPSYDYCVPEKSCSASSDSPCEMFARLEFPTEEFFPPNVSEVSGETTPSCGCQPKEEEE